MSAPAARIQIVAERLAREGYGGLYVPGECGCVCGDLAPCGCAEPDDAGWINGCDPGFRHDDPRPGKAANWLVSGRKEPPPPEAFDLT